MYLDNYRQNWYKYYKGYNIVDEVSVASLRFKKISDVVIDNHR